MIGICTISNGTSCFPKSLSNAWRHHAGCHWPALLILAVNLQLTCYGRGLLKYRIYGYQNQYGDTKKAKLMPAISECCYLYIHFILGPLHSKSSPSDVGKRNIQKKALLMAGNNMCWAAKCSMAHKMACFGDFFPFYFDKPIVNDWHDVKKGGSLSTLLGR